jgi:hypothetical protein
MRALTAVVTMSMLILGAASSVAGQQTFVSIDTSMLPLSTAHSFAHGVAVAQDPRVSAHWATCNGGKGNTGLDGRYVWCTEEKSSPGTITEARSFSSAMVQAGVGTLEASVYAVKDAGEEDPIAAAAAYAQGGGTVKKVGQMLGTYLTLTQAGLKLSGADDPVYPATIVSFNNLDVANRELLFDYALVYDRAFDATIKTAEAYVACCSEKADPATREAYLKRGGTFSPVIFRLLQSGYRFVVPSAEYLRLAVFLDNQGNVAVRRPSRTGAVTKCQGDPEASTTPCLVAEVPLKENDFVEVCGRKSHADDHDKRCKKKARSHHHQVETGAYLARVWLPLDQEVARNISIDQIHCAGHVDRKWIGQGYNIDCEVLKPR